MIERLLRGAHVILPKYITLLELLNNQERYKTFTKNI